MDTTTLPFQIGDRARLTLGRDIEGVITAFLVRSGWYVSYEFSYLVNGESKSTWVVEIELVKETNKDKVGFSHG